MLKLILTGPESSGKTTLSRILATHFDVNLVEEYARAYLENKFTSTDGKYQPDDLVQIAQGQYHLEQQTIQQAYKPLIICDTDLLTIIIWSKEVFGYCDDIIENLYKRPIDNISELYLLCSPDDVEWEFDTLRENPHDRHRLFEVYEKNLQEYQKNYVILRGGIDERFGVAKGYIESIHQ